MVNMLDSIICINHFLQMCKEKTSREYSREVPPVISTTTISAISIVHRKIEIYKEKYNGISERNKKLW